MKKLLLLLVIVILLIFFPFFIEDEKIIMEKKKEDPLVVTTKTEESVYTLLFVGDIMLCRGVRHMVEKHGEDYTFPFLYISETLQSADILFGNLESMISDKGVNIGSIYSFRAHPQAIDGLTYAGFDIVSLANNHAFDYDREAFEDTMHRLTDNNILYTGAGFNIEEAHSPTIIELEDKTKVGFLGYTEFLFPYAYANENRSGITMFSMDNMKKDIEKGKQNVDILVVTFHYGEEYQKIQNENQEFISRMAIDYGADIIIGHHPHVTQEVEEYKNKYIAYSLGNFVFDQYFSEETMKGFMIEAKVKDKEIVEINKIHYKLNEYFQPQLIEL